MKKIRQRQTHSAHKQKYSKRFKKNEKYKIKIIGNCYHTTLACEHSQCVRVSERAIVTDRGGGNYPVWEHIVHIVEPKHKTKQSM